MWHLDRHRDCPVGGVFFAAKMSVRFLSVDRTKSDSLLVTCRALRLPLDDSDHFMLSPSFSARLEPFGFSAKLTGGHMARSMMFEEMRILQESLPLEAKKEDFKRAIVEENILGKPTQSSREKSFHHLVELYGMDPGLALFRVLRTLGNADRSSFPLMAATCVYSRDPQLRASFELIQSKRDGQEIPRVEMEELLEASFPDRFSPAMKKSLAQNVNTTWTFSGHLEGRSKKTRRLPVAGFGAVTFAMFVGWLSGLRGELLLSSVYGRLVNAEPGTILHQLRQASAHQWLRLRSGGGVTEIDFSPLLTPSEVTLLP